jgi:hypothetical protein
MQDSQLCALHLIEACRCWLTHLLGLWTYAVHKFFAVLVGSSVCCLLDAKYISTSLSLRCLVKIYVQSNLRKSGSSCTALFVNLCHLNDDDDDDDDVVPGLPALGMLSVPVYQQGRTFSSLCIPSCITGL